MEAWRMKRRREEDPMSNFTWNLYCYICDLMYNKCFNPQTPVWDINNVQHAGPELMLSISLYDWKESVSLN
jgi:hypothetical protein